MAASASSFFNLDANPSQGEGQVPFTPQKSSYPSFAGNFSQIMPTGMPFFTGYPNSTMAPSFFPMAPFPFTQDNPFFTTSNMGATAMPHAPKSSSTAMEGIIDSNPVPMFGNILTNPTSCTRVQEAPETISELSKHCNHHGEMVNDDITAALESFTLDSGPSDSLMNAPNHTADHDIQQELVKLRHDNELLKTRMESLSALQSLTPTTEHAATWDRHSRTSRGMHDHRPYPAVPHTRGTRRPSPPRADLSFHETYYASLQGYDPSCTVPITAVDATSMIDVAHTPNNWVIVDRISNVITAIRRKQSVNLVCERNGRPAPYPLITDGERTLLTQWNHRRPRWLGQIPDLKPQTQDGNNGRDLPLLPPPPVKVTAPEDTCLDPQLWASFIFLHGTERHYPGISVTTTGSVNIRTLAGYLLFQSIIPSNATRVNRHGFAIALASVLVHPIVYSDICRDRHLTIADSEKLVPFPLSLISRASQFGIVTHLAKCGVKYSHICYIQPYGRELLLAATRRFKGTLRTRAYKALDDFAWRIHHFDLPRDISVFQDNSAPQIYWTAPIEWDLIPILEARRRHFLNYPIIREATSKSNRCHQHTDRVDYRAETSLPVTGDADVPMAGDGDASHAGPSITHLSTAPTASPSTKASIAMTITSGSNSNVDGEADELDSQDNNRILL
ncbi:uncharacterized protein EV420DRAFT_1526098 [Desarmillaria tabescens]|uniref:Uncharacterized protein n=1 Tax=Armillaria tabescens TaxID=1929756 RepID=A0AA39NBM4_ARMTA|nr:uncharacterized protein EV420DRAFT_1526098 [Desarmillaria tabescens]KAK0462655.1 hypothetical protein EV420DRAFT_1526098 [Desarmillaria tabescens]